MNSQVGKTGLRRLEKIYSHNPFIHYEAFHRQPVDCETYRRSEGLMNGSYDDFRSSSESALYMIGYH